MDRGSLQSPWPPLSTGAQRTRTSTPTGTRRLDKLRDTVSIHLDKLREYRQALINAAVTGKIDLSKEAA